MLENLNIIDVMPHKRVYEKVVGKQAEKSTSRERGK